MDPRDAIKARIPIEELVGEYCQLTRKGRNFVCVCPFHNDTHPSFLVSPDKGIGYCFACQTGGDIFSFYQQIEGVDFPEAIKDLAEKAGVELPKEAHSGPKKDEKQRLRACLDTACAFFQATLKNHQGALTYLQGRGVDSALMEKFQIGMAPDSFSATYDHLLQKGHSKSDIVAAGLAVQKDLQNDNVYDRFRNRIMFPIIDHQGNICGFGGRAMKEGDAKYVNSPEGPLYHKSTVMYGLSMAKEAMRTASTVVLVEGYFDVIASHKVGIEQTVAVSGTALTVQHAKLLGRYAEKAILALDQDRAGKDAAMRAFSILTKEGINVHAVALPTKDPDELVQKDPDAYKKAIAEGSVPFIDYIIADIKSSIDVTDPQGKREASAILLPLVRALPTAVEQEGYIEKVSALLGVATTAVREDMQSGADKQQKIVENHTVQPDKTPYTRRELCIGLAFLYPEERRHLNTLIADDNPLLEAARTACINHEKEEGIAVIDAIEASQQEKEHLRVLLLFCEQHFADWSAKLAEREVIKLCRATNRDTIKQKQQDIIKKLRSARQTGRSDEELQLLTQYQQSMKLLKMSV